MAIVLEKEEENKLVNIRDNNWSRRSKACPLQTPSAGSHHGEFLLLAVPLPSLGHVPGGK